MHDSSDGMIGAEGDQQMSGVVLVPATWELTVRKRTVCK